MGDWQAAAVIGCLIPPGAMPTIKRMAKCFPHDFPADMKYCPQTGRKLWDEEELPKFIFTGVDGGPEQLSPEQTAIVHPGWLRLFRADNNERHWHDPWIESVFGCGVEGPNDNENVAHRGIIFHNDLGEMTPYSIVGWRNAIFEVLNPHGLWNPKLFGLYAILLYTG